MSFVTAYLLCGCLTARADLTIRADDTVDGSVVLAVDREQARHAGGARALVEALTRGGSPFDTRPSAGSVERRPYRSGGLVGVEYVLSGVPLADVSGVRSTDLSIVRDRNRYLVTGAVDLTADRLGVEPSRLRGADVRLSVTFPVAVVRANGTVDGHTVTWEPPLGAVTRVSAVGEAADQGHRTPVVAVLLVLLVTLMAAFAVLLVLLRRARRARAVASAGCD